MNALRRKNYLVELEYLLLMRPCSAMPDRGNLINSPQRHQQRRTPAMHHITQTSRKGEIRKKQVETHRAPHTGTQGRLAKLKGPHSLFLGLRLLSRPFNSHHPYWLGFGSRALESPSANLRPVVRSHQLNRPQHWASCISLRRIPSNAWVSPPSM